MSFPKFSTITTTVTLLLLILIPTFVVWVYFQSLDLNLLNKEYIHYYAIAPMCMGVGFISLVIYLFVWLPPQQVTRAQLRDLWIILLAWMSFALTWTFSLLGFGDFYFEFNNVDIPDVIVVVAWLVWGYFNVRRLRKLDFEDGPLATAVLWSCLAFLIPTYQFWQQFLSPMIKLIMTGRAY